jgi:hypothetical protein
MAGDQSLTLLARKRSAAQSGVYEGERLRGTNASQDTKALKESLETLIRQGMAPPHNGKQA